MSSTSCTYVCLAISLPHCAANREWLSGMLATMGVCRNAARQNMVRASRRPLHVIHNDDGFETIGADANRCRATRLYGQPALMATEPVTQSWVRNRAGAVVADRA